MPSLRHKDAVDREGVEDGLLDAARASILDVGWRRSTLTDVARRAGVSRMTIYRRWPDMTTLLADLMTREWSGLVEPPRPDEPPLARVAAGVSGTVAALRSNELFAKIVQDGSIRAGDPVLLSRSVLLASYGFALSAPTMTDTGRDLGDLDAELRRLVERYLAP